VTQSPEPDSCFSRRFAKIAAPRIHNQSDGSRTSLEFAAPETVAGIKQAASLERGKDGRHNPLM